MELAYEENDILPWRNDGVLKGCKKGDIVFIIIKDNNENKVMYKCTIEEENFDVSKAVNDSNYWFDEAKKEESEKSRTGTCFLLKKLQHIDDERLYMKKLKEQGLTKRHFEQNHTTDKYDEKKVEDSNSKIKLFDRLDDIFNEYLDIENVFKSINKESINISEKYRQDYVKTRIGQGKFRDLLIKKHGCKCDICGLDIKELLIASHIKEYVNCNNNEHIDAKNGLLLCTNHDKLFDRHLISFDYDGKIIISKFIDLNNYNKLNIDSKMSIDKNMFDEKYMMYHRKKLK